MLPSTIRHERTQQPRAVIPATLCTSYYLLRSQLPLYTLANLPVFCTFARDFCQAPVACVGMPLRGTPVVPGRRRPRLHTTETMGTEIGHS